MKKKMNKILISLMIVLLMLPIVSSERVSAFSPHDVESSVRNNWNKIYGTKNNNMRLEETLFMMFILISIKIAAMLEDIESLIEILETEINRI